MNNKIVSLTKSAVQRLRSFSNNENEELNFRFGLKYTGKCKDYVYIFEKLSDDFDKNDIVSNFSDDNINIVIKQDDVKGIKGTIIDYINDKMSGNIIFNNPNVAQSCGCGESVSIAKDN